MPNFLDLPYELKLDILEQTLSTSPKSFVALVSTHPSLYNNQALLSRLLEGEFCRRPLSPTVVRLEGVRPRYPLYKIISSWKQPLAILRLYQAYDNPNSPLPDGRKHLLEAEAAAIITNILDDANPLKPRDIVDTLTIHEIFSYRKADNNAAVLSPARLYFWLILQFCHSTWCEPKHYSEDFLTEYPTLAESIKRLLGMDDLGAISANREQVWRVQAKWHSRSIHGFGCVRRPMMEECFVAKLPVKLLLRRILVSDGSFTEKEQKLTDAAVESLAEEGWRFPVIPSEEEYLDYVNKTGMYAE